jgi:hypothetical protein
MGPINYACKLSYLGSGNLNKTAKKFRLKKKSTGDLNQDVFSFNKNVAGWLPFRQIGQFNMVLFSFFSPIFPGSPLYFNICFYS